MKKKLLAAIMATAMVALTACGGAAASGDAASSDAAAPAASSDAAAPAESGSGKKVAVAMPTQSSERWMQDQRRREHEEPA